MFSLEAKAVITIWITLSWYISHTIQVKAIWILFEWYAEIRHEFQPSPIHVHYLKNIYLYSVEHELIDKHTEELFTMEFAL